MPRKIRENGMILVVCPNCGKVYNVYELLSKSSKEKYMGSPIPRRGVQKYDIKVSEDGTFKCIACEATLSIKPMRVFVLRYKLFLEEMFFDYEKHVLRPKRSESIVPVSVEDVMARQGLVQDDSTGATVDTSL